MAPRNSRPGILRRNTTPSEKVIRRTVAPTTHQKIAFLRNSGGSFLVAIQIRIALSPLITISMRMILRRANNPALVASAAKSVESVSNIVRG